METAYEVTAKIGTDPIEFRMSAIAAEGSLECANDCLGRFRWKVLVAAFADKAQLKQNNLPGEEGRNPAHGAVNNALVNPS